MSEMVFFAAMAGGAFGAIGSLTVVAFVLAWNQARLTRKATEQVSAQVQAARQRLQAAQLAILGINRPGQPEVEPEPSEPIH